MASKISWKKDERLQRILKQNAKRRDWEREQRGEYKNLDRTFTIIFTLGFILYGLAILAIGITWPLILLGGGILAGIALSFVV